MSNAGDITDSGSSPLLEAQDLTKHFPVAEGLIFSKVKGWVKAVDGVSFTAHAGETLGIVGESGCGKTTITKLILLLERPTTGSVLFRGKNIWSLPRSERSVFRRAVQAVFQDTTSALNPRMNVAEIIGEPMIALGGFSKKAIADRVGEVLEDVGLSKKCVSRYPHEFSGGQRQRLALARAVAPRPKCVILDEPVSALDVSVRAQILNLLKDLQTRNGFSYIMIAHDLAAVRYLSTKIGVMYLGKMVEVSESAELFSNPLHPYTRALLAAILPTRPGVRRPGTMLRGEVPSAFNPPSGCRFYPRCDSARPACSESAPELKDFKAGHLVSCHLHS